MVTAALWLALATGISCDGGLPASTLGDEPGIEAKQIVACESGGMNSESCNINCHRLFNFYTSSCEVSCQTGYFACCNCNGGCHCVIDHEEMWPLPPPPDLPPGGQIS